MYFHGQLPDDRLYTPAEARALFERHHLSVAQARPANMLPLTLTADWVNRVAPVIWPLNRALSRVPILNLLATNVEVTARRSSRSAW